MGGGAPTTSRQSSVRKSLLEAPPIFGTIQIVEGMAYYEQDIKISHATGALQSYFFSTNGLYDPNVSGTGHQPVGFDQLMLFFEQYCVYRSRIRVLFNCTSAPADAGFGVSVAIALSPDAVLLSDTRRLVENGLVKVQWLAPVLASSAGSRNHCEMEMACDNMKYFGRNQNPKEYALDTDVCGNAGANPLEQAYFGLHMWGNPSGETSTVYITVFMEFDVLFQEPRKVALSLDNDMMQLIKRDDALKKGTSETGLEDWASTGDKEVKEESPLRVRVQDTDQLTMLTTIMGMMRNLGISQEHEEVKKSSK